MQSQSQFDPACETTSFVEDQRLNTLRKYDILDTPPEESFDRITRLAARFFDVPIALISMTDVQRQWIKSRVGIDFCEVKRDISPCADVAVKGEVLVIEDARQDPCYAANPLVTGPPHIRFYAGAPLRTPDGISLGTLCLIDHKPRTVSAEDVNTLCDLADEVVEQLERRRAEKSAHASKRQFERIVESITDAFLILDEHWRFTYINTQAEQHMRRPKAEMLGAHIWDAFPDLSGTGLARALHHAMEEGSAVKLTEYLPGLGRWMDVRAYPYEHGLSVYFSDVTDRVRDLRFQEAQARIMEMVASGAPLKETLTALVHAVEARSGDFTGSILLLDADEQRLWLGAAPSLPASYVEAVDGLKIGPAVGACGTAAYTGKAVITTDIATDPRWADYNLALEHNLRACWSKPIIGSDGQVLGTFALYYQEPCTPLEADMHLIETASHVAGIAIERSQWLKTLRKDEERLKAIFNQVAVGIAQIDLDGRYVLVNQRFCEMLGRTEEEVLGSHLTDVTHGDDAAQTQQMLDRLIAGENYLSFDKRYVRPDGSFTWVSNNVSRITDREGNMQFALGVVADITDRKRAEELQRSNRDLEQFAYVASHDLQEPLRKIQSFGDLLSSAYHEALDAEGRFYLDRIQQSASRMQALITDLLAYSRASTQKRPLRRVNLRLITQEVLNDLEAMIGRTGGQVEIGELPTIQGDPVQMRQLLQNLIGNALKFSRQGSPPVVKIYADTLQDLSPEADSPMCRLYVEDNGIGIDEKYLKQIFMPFQRLHSREHYEGSGIGLAICKKIVDRHGGLITARSKPGSGTTFMIHLPNHG